jgi:hypothetical protein
MRGTTSKQRTITTLTADIAAMEALTAGLTKPKAASVKRTFRVERDTSPHSSD